MRRPARKSRKNLVTRRIFLGIGILSLLYPLYAFIGFRLPRKPQRIEVAKQILPGQFRLFPNFILFARENRVWAVSRKCTHLGCTLHYVEKDDLLECPCHQSRFSTDGRLLNGPAKAALKTYPVEIRQDPPFYIVTL
jgi:Rieske Fe-S protein